MKQRMSLAGVLAALMIGAGWVVGVRPPGDNSFLTHLATGRIILDEHSIPTHDLYSFSAHGAPWVVQSWLASIVYAVADNIGGFRTVMVVLGLCTMVLTAIIWRLTEPAHTLVPRVGITAVTLVIGAEFWVERPLLFGLVCLGFVLLAAEGRLRPQWLIPAMWIWVNVHGSFPLGLLALVLLALGRRLDGGDPKVELRALKFAAIGTVLAAVNPLGPRLLVFPLELLRRQDILQKIVEWQAPSFLDLAQRGFLLEIAVGALLLVRRPSWRIGLPYVVFVVAALLGARNIVVASIVLVPGLAAGLEGLGSLDGSERKAIYRPIAALVLAMEAILGFSALRQPGAKIESHYPVAAIEYAQDRDLLKSPHRLVAQDFVGNYIEGRLGTDANVFIDDRYDMYPKQVVDDYVTLLGAKPGWDRVLDRYDADAVLWEREQPLAQVLDVSSDWRVVYRDARWILAVRRDRQAP